MSKFSYLKCICPVGTAGAVQVNTNSLLSDGSVWVKPFYKYSNTLYRIANQVKLFN